jgi:hypothetical protein
MRDIFINEVLAEVNKPNAVFSIGFWKDGGSYTVKDGVVNRSANLNERKKMNRNGLLKCYQKSNNSIFDVTIDLIMTFNNMKILRPE